MVSLWIANTITDLIQGDVREHLPLERIPLAGDVLGLGTTTSVDNGELSFLHDPAAGRTRLYKCQASDGRLRELHRNEGSSHFPYVCFTGDATALRRPVDPAGLGAIAGRSLQDVVGEAITGLLREGRMEPAPLYGLRLRARWHSLVITVASKLCMGQQHRNTAIASTGTGTADGEDAASSLYASLQHFRLASEDPADPKDPIRFLGRSLQWDCCGFWDTEPMRGRVTVPLATAHLHLHGCSRDLAFGGHLHHEHPGTRLEALESLVVYPLHDLVSLGSDLAVENAAWADGVLRFSVVNQGQLDVNDVGIAIVIDDRYSDHRYLRLPWFAAGAVRDFALPLPLTPGRHELLVLADPERDVLEPSEQRANNRATILIDA
jgi:hypothetical protein